MEIVEVFGSSDGHSLPVSQRALAEVDRIGRKTLVAIILSVIGCCTGIPGLCLHFSTNKVWASKNQFNLNVCSVFIHLFFSKLLSTPPAAVTETLPQPFAGSVDQQQLLRDVMQEYGSKIRELMSGQKALEEKMNAEVDNLKFMIHNQQQKQSFPEGQSDAIQNSKDKNCCHQLQSTVEGKQAINLGKI
jgi:hypothetical protein